MTQTSACAGVEALVAQGLQGFDRSPEGHVDLLEGPCHEALWGHQDVGQSGDEAQGVLAPVDDATTPDSDSCAGSLPWDCPGGEKEQILTGQPWREGLEEVPAEAEVPADQVSCGPAGVQSCSGSSLGWAERGAGPGRGRKLPV